MGNGNVERKNERQVHRTYTLLGSDKRPYESETPETYGGHRKGKIYGQLHCRSALRAIEKEGYQTISYKVRRTS